MTLLAINRWVNSEFVCTTEECGSSNSRVRGPTVMNYESNKGNTEKTTQISETCNEKARFV